MRARTPAVHIPDIAGLVFHVKHPNSPRASLRIDSADLIRPESDERRSRGGFRVTTGTATGLGAPSASPLVAIADRLLAPALGVFHVKHGRSGRVGWITLGLRCWMQG